MLDMSNLEPDPAALDDERIGKVIEEMCSCQNSVLTNLQRKQLADLITRSQGLFREPMSYKLNDPLSMANFRKYWQKHQQRMIYARNQGLQFKLNHELYHPDLRWEYVSNIVSWRTIRIYLSTAKCAPCRVGRSCFRPSKKKCLWPL